MRGKQDIPTATLTDLLPNGGGARNVTIRNRSETEVIYCQVTGENEPLTVDNGMPIDPKESFSYYGRINEKAPIQVIHEAAGPVEVRYIFE